MDEGGWAAQTERVQSSGRICVHTHKHLVVLRIQTQLCPATSSTMSLTVAHVSFSFLHPVLLSSSGVSPVEAPRVVAACWGVGVC